MKNVTISMDDADLAWVRAQAGSAGVSVSRWMAEQLRVRRERQATAVEANRTIAALLAQLHAQPFTPEPRIQTYREMIEEESDERFRRFDDASLSTGSEREDQRSDLRHVAERNAAFRHSGSEPTDSE